MGSPPTAANRWTCSSPRSAGFRCRRQTGVSVWLEKKCFDGPSAIFLYIPSSDCAPIAPLTFAVSGSTTLENNVPDQEADSRCPLLAKRIVWFGSSSYTLYRGTLPWARPMALPRRYQYAPPPAGINGTTAQRSDDDGRRTHKELSRYLGEVSCSYCGARGALPYAPCGECALPYCSKQCLEEGRARHHRKLCDKGVSECDFYAARRGRAATCLALVERDRLAMAALLGQNTRLRLRGSAPIECIVCKLPRTGPPCPGFFFGRRGVNCC